MLVAGVMYGQTDLTRDVSIRVDVWDGVNDISQRTAINNIAPERHLRYGSADLLRADNHAMFATGCYLLSAIAWSSYTYKVATYDPYVHGLDNGRMPLAAIGVVSTGTAIGFMVSSRINQRRGLKRIYWGMNGITIPLN